MGSCFDTRLVEVSGSLMLNTQLFVVSASLMLNTQRYVVSASLSFNTQLCVSGSLSGLYFAWKCEVVWKAVAFVEGNLAL